MGANYALDANARIHNPGYEKENNEKVVNFNPLVYNSCIANTEKEVNQAMRVVGYVRVSTEEQAKHNLSIPDQTRQIKDFCNRNGYTLVHVYEENGKSASNDNRPALQQMMGDLENDALTDIAGLVVLKTSRFFRNVKMSLEYQMRLRSVGVRLISVDGVVGGGDAEDDDPMQEVIETITSAFDQLESRNIGFHTARGMRENARQGYWNGSAAPYGYRTCKFLDEKGNRKSRLEVNEEEAALVKRIFKMYTEDGIGSYRIASQLNQEKVQRRGKKWTSPEILKILHNPVYVGVYIYNKYNRRLKRPRPQEQWIPVKTTPIISDKTFEAATKMADDKTPAKRNTFRDNGPLLFTGMLHCSHCGSQMVSAGTVKKKDKNGNPIKPQRYTYYSCKNRLKSGKSACKGLWVNAPKFEQVVMDELLAWIFSEENVKIVVAAIKKALAQQTKPLQKLREEQKRLQTQITRYLDAFEQGHVEMSSIADRLRELREQENRIAHEIDGRSNMTDIPKMFTEIKDLHKIQMQLQQVFREAPVRIKRQYLSVLIEYIRFDGEKVEVKAKSNGIIAILEAREGATAQDVAGVISSRKNWQPVGDSNPRDGTENPAS